MPIDHMLKFAREAIRNYRNTGAVAPSSQRLAKAMLRRMPAGGGRRILEVGPGTGAFTRPLLAALRPADEFHLVEVNPQFCRQIDRRLLNAFRRRHPDIGVHLHCLPVEAFEVEVPFDFIICGLPFNNFPLPLVRGIFRHMLGMLAEGGEMAYFEYAGVRIMKAPLVGPRGRRSLRRRKALQEVLQRRHDGDRQFVLGNVPPAVTLRLRRTTKSSTINGI